MPYCIKTYIPIEAENPEIYKTIQEAKIEHDHCSSMQLENLYVIVEYDEKNRGNE